MEVNRVSMILEREVITISDLLASALFQRLRHWPVDDLRQRSKRSLVHVEREPSRNEVGVFLDGSSCAKRQSNLLVQ